MSIADEVPFEIPESWEWVRASSLGQMVRGKGIKRTETIPDGMPCVRYGEIYTTYNTSFTNTKSFIPQQLYSQCNLFHKGDLIFTLTGENKHDIAKTVAYLGESPVAAGGDMAYWTYHKMNPLYLVYFMASPYCIEQKRRLATGDIIVHISTDKVGSFLVPVPPKAEQDRIVAKLQEIAPLLQEYDRKEQKIHLEQQLFPEQLKKSILQIAVQGKLVPQDPSDEPASVLLERIRTEKERLIAEGKIKRDKNESAIFRRDNSHYENHDDKERCIDDEIPFDIPESWAWVRLSSVANLSLGKMLDKAKNKGVLQPYLRNVNVRWGSFDLDDILQMRFTDDEDARYSIQSGDVIMCEGGEPGRCAVWEHTSKFKIQKALHRIRPYPMVSGRYLYLLFSLYAKNGYFSSLFTGTTIKHLPGAKLAQVLVPLPPRNEQVRIIGFANTVMIELEKLTPEFSL